MNGKLFGFGSQKAPEIPLVGQKLVLKDYLLVGLTVCRWGHPDEPLNIVGRIGASGGVCRVCGRVWSMTAIRHDPVANTIAIDFGLLQDPTAANTGNTGSGG